MSTAITTQATFTEAEKHLSLLLSALNAMDTYPAPEVIINGENIHLVRARDIKANLETEEVTSEFTSMLRTLADTLEQDTEKPQ